MILFVPWNSENLTPFFAACSVRNRARDLLFPVQKQSVSDPGIAVGSERQHIRASGFGFS